MKLATYGLVIALVGVLGALLLGVAVGPVAAQDGTVYVTAQRFEHGQMIWRSDNGDIWVLFDDGRAMGFASSVYGDLPDPDLSWLTIPPGRQVPINGFGRVWGHYPTVRDGLGWATWPEIGFNAPVTQRGGTLYLTQLNGRVIEIVSGGTWQYVAGVPSPAARILRFEATPATVTPGGTVTLSWAVEGTEGALIEMLAPDGSLLSLVTDLPTSGTTTFSAPLHGESVRFVLWAANRGRFPVLTTMYERVVSSELAIVISQAEQRDEFTSAAFQWYERGFMIWRADTGSVIVFWGGHTGGRWTEFPEDQYGPLPDNTLTDPPPGLVVPVRGFGRVWGNFDYVRDQVGWATAPEEAYTLFAQSLGGTPLTFLLPDGRTVEITRGYWRIR